MKFSKRLVALFKRQANTQSRMISPGMHQLESLEPRMLMSGNPIITEFMASNDNTIDDGNGNSSDWIEIYNDSSEPADLSGWHLTDDATDLNQWQFPNGTTLGAGQYLIVFADGADNTDPGGFLHTNFALRAAGEYLALVQPDELTIASEFNPVFPPQAEDISYGVPMDTTSQVLVGPGDDVNYLIPTDNTNQATWFQSGFDDSTWNTGSSGVGFDAGVPAPGHVATWALNDNAGSPSAFEPNGLSGSVTGSVTFGGVGATGNTSTAANFTGTGSIDIPYNDSLNPDSFTFAAWARVTGGQGGYRSLVTSRQDDGNVHGYIIYANNLNQWSFWTGGGGLAGTWDSINGPAVELNEWTHVAISYDDATSTKTLYVNGVASGSKVVNYVPNPGTDTHIGGGADDGTQFRFQGDIDDATLFDRSLDVTEIQNLMNNGAPTTSSVDFSPHIQTDLQAEMLGVNPSAYLRSTFDLTDASAFSSMQLSMKYDDGFIAYLNGVEVAKQNAPTVPAYNSVATGSRPDSDVVDDVVFDLTSFMDQLIVGTNTLAIQVFNNTTNDDDLLLDPKLELVSSTVSDTVVGYFQNPTPGSANPSATDLVGPLINNVSHTPDQPKANEAIVVTAEISELNAAIDSVSLTYRVMYGTEIQTIMTDDGTGDDLVAADGIFTGTIPGNIAAAGQMIRYYITATDIDAATTRAPAFLDQVGKNQSAEYFGTVVLGADDTPTVEGPLINAGGNVTSNTPNFFPISQASDGVTTTAWVTDAPGGGASDYFAFRGPAEVIFDLGQDSVINAAAFWAYSTNANANRNSVKDFSLQFATEADGTSGFGTSITYNPQFIAQHISQTNRQDFNFDQNVNARYVKMIITDNYYDGLNPGGDRIGFSEMQFVGVVPPPLDTKYLIPQDDALGLTWTQPAFDDSAWSDATSSIGFDPGNSGLLDLITTDVNTEMTGSDSLYYRKTFTIDDLDLVDSLELEITIDSGFIAYINGIPAASLNAPGAPDHQSAATLERDNGQSSQTMTFDLESLIAALQQGDNVLAIHAMNSASDADFIIDADVVVTESSPVPLFQWFTESVSASHSRAGTRASVFYDGQFYDNIFVRQRGQATNSSASQKFDFNKGDNFYVNDYVGEVGEININGNGSDPAYVRQALGFDTFELAEAQGSHAFMMNMRVNGSFDRVGIAIEQVDENFLERNDLDPEGALYKFVQRQNLDPVFNDIITGIEKKTRQFEDFSDLQELINGLHLPTAAERSAYIFDNFNVPQLMNYLAVRAITQDTDDTRKNFYMYRDTNGTGEWYIFPWDEDFTFGIEGDGGANGRHPFFAEFEHLKANANQWNVLYDVIFESTIQDYDLQQLYLRRLRTLMDELLAAPNGNDSVLELRKDQLVESISSFGVATGLAGLDAYFPRRRDDLFVLHSIDNVPTPVTTLLNATNPSTAFVPTDDSLGDTWQLVGFNDTAWQAGTNGVGYEESAANTYTSLIGNNVASLLDTNNDDTNEQDTVYIRLPFNVADASVVSELTLRMKYDDGFVAYLNGTQIAARNNPDPLLFNSAATGQHDDNLALQYENINVTAFVSSLVTGDNVLAIQGMNANLTSSDMIILAELVSGVVGNDDSAGIPHEQVELPDIVIDNANILFNPASGNQDEEYIPLVNNSDTAVDISGWSLTGGVQYTFQPGTVIPANATLYVSPNVNAFRASGLATPNFWGLYVQGNYSGHISNLGEQIDLVKDDGLTVISSVVTASEPSIYQENLRITEVHYNPTGATQNEIDAGFFDGDQFEFIELQNISETETLDLNGVQFTNGVIFDFTGSAYTSLAPGEYVLVVADQAAFAQRYGTEAPDGRPYNIAGAYTGDNLQNGGETIKLEGPDSDTIHEFKYEDGSNLVTEADWDARTDGNGPSLSIIDPTATEDSWALGSSWRASGVDHGTPGRPDPIDGGLAGDFNYDGIVNIADLAKLASNFNKNANTDPSLDIRWQHGDSNNDGIVNIADLAKLASNFNKTQLFGGAASADILTESSTTNNGAIQLTSDESSDSDSPSSWDHIGSLLDDEDTTSIL